MSAGMQPRERALERGLVLPRDRALLELVARRVGRVLELLVDQALDEPVLAQQRRDFGERVLHALARLGALGHRGVGAVGHGGNSRRQRCQRSAERHPPVQRSRRSRILAS